MGKRLTRHLTFANVIAATGVFIVLGGTSFAAATKLGRNSVKGRNIDRAHRIPVEERKTGADRGRFLTPELFGQPASKAIGGGG